MKQIKNTGLIFVVAACVAFIASLFLDRYQMSEKTLNKAGMTPQQSEFFLNHVAPSLNSPSSKLIYIRELKKALEFTNEDIATHYAVDSETVEKLANRSWVDGKVTYSPALARQILNPEDKYDAFKLKGISDYTSWMDGREYESFDTFEKDLKKSILNFNETLIYQFGFDSYSLDTKLLTMVLASGNGLVSRNQLLFFLMTFVLMLAGALLFIIPKFYEGEPGIKNNGIFKDPLNARGWAGILLGSFLILFYIFLYFFPVYIAEWINLAGVISEPLFNRETSQWFLYGMLYTLAVLIMGLRFLTKYRHNRYQQFRTFSVMFFQLGFAFVLPQILYALNLPEVDMKNIWPLDYSFFYDWRIDSYMQSGVLGMSMMVWGIGLFAGGVPVLTYFYGKRWYCSWVCGCGGLAETAGDSFRQLSSKKLSAWKIERYLIHSVLVFAVVMTVWVFYTTLTSKSTLLGISSYEVRKVYGFLISSVFAGVVGTGFYPLMGNRVWCRFGCPLAAYLGMVQKFKSRFRITTNGGQCISCGNCSTYCEMGIDVRWYAQRGQNIIRSSCVGCGICAAVCPRGVLKLENSDEKGRYNEAFLPGNDGIINIRASRLQNKEINS